MVANENFEHRKNEIGKLEQLEQDIPKLALPGDGLIPSLRPVTALSARDVSHNRVR